jgi:hypothetical protein
LMAYLELGRRSFRSVPLRDPGTPRRILVS